MFFIFPLIRRQVKEEGKLRAMTVSLSARSQTLEHAALTDGLTGMQNRRYFDDALKEYLDEFRRIEKPVGLMIVDLDHFKQINDTHGHDVGDEVLRAVAGCLKDMTRYHDVVARLGGEEFAVVAPNMDSETLVRFAERIRKAIAGMAIVVGQCPAEDHRQRRAGRLGPQGNAPRRCSAAPTSSSTRPRRRDVTASAPESVVPMIQVMPACTRRRLSALPVLTYPNVRSAPVLESHTIRLGLTNPSSNFPSSA